ncbi:hypothetical protein [Inquilinus sp. CAU 1745]|uniref:hypothetical protein n=1 Tax=Inquilinus sp. CAU 1745 TaxID=3140369 RepID=UPI00325A7B6E
MKVGDVFPNVRGYITQDKFLIGRTLAELERNLGFHTGRLMAGALFVKLDALPAKEAFELGGYSMTAKHRFEMPRGFDVSKLKAMAMERWTLTGPDRLIKVLAETLHDEDMTDDDQYPPGLGIPQWNITDAVPGTVVATPKTWSDRYRPQL